MEKISFLARSTKSSGEIKLRFRLRDGRDIDITSKSDIKAKLEDLTKFNPDGTLAKGVRIFNRELRQQISDYIGKMRDVYSQMKSKGMQINASSFNRMMEDAGSSVEAQSCDNTMLTRFKAYYESNHRNGFIGDGRLKHYVVSRNELERFLIINDCHDIEPGDFDTDMVLRFRLFLAEEYKYVKTWSNLYKRLRAKNIPSNPRSSNTIAEKMCILSSFFTELEDLDEIAKSPFRKLGKDKRRSILKEEYDEPFFLTMDEFAKVSSTDVPNKLKETKYAFLLHCTLGCRISDFKAITFDDLSVRDGIPYIHYIPQKTQNKSKQEVETPIVLQSLNIIKEYGFDYSILNNPWGSRGYNNYIKLLLEHCGIDRQVKKYNTSTNKYEFHPLYELASSKLCRKTYVDMMAKVQINQYASGLHKVGSDAVGHYTSMTLHDRFVLACAAFNQPQFKVDDNLNIIG